jgi:hypothetical protein
LTISGISSSTAAPFHFQTDVQTVQSDARRSRPGEAGLPNQTNAGVAVSTLTTAVNQLPPSPTPEQLSLAPDISAAVTAAKNFDSATSSACD